MPKKCESCRFYKHRPGDPAGFALCTSDDVYGESPIPEDPAFLRDFIRIGDAREICDREGDGVFVYFEPNADAADEVGDKFLTDFQNGIDRYLSTREGLQYIYDQAAPQTERTRELERALAHYADESNWEHHESGVDGDGKKQYKAVCYNGEKQNGYDIAREVLGSEAK